MSLENICFKLKKRVFSEQRQSYSFLDKQIIVSQHSSYYYTSDDLNNTEVMIKSIMLLIVLKTYTIV